MALIFLALLVLLDAALSGFRAAAGLSARIDKSRYYGRALLRGAALGAGLMLTMGAATCAIAATVRDAAGFERDVTVAVHRLGLAFGPVALVGVAVLLVRALPSVDLRSLASTLFFGPFTLLRPLVIAAGAAWTVAGIARPDVQALVLLACAGMLAVSRVARRARLTASTKQAPGRRGEASARSTEEARPSQAAPTRPDR